MLIPLLAFTTVLAATDVAEVEPLRDETRRVIERLVAVAGDVDNAKDTLQLGAISLELARTHARLDQLSRCASYETAGEIADLVKRARKLDPSAHKKASAEPLFAKYKKTRTFIEATAEDPESDATLKKVVLDVDWRSKDLLANAPASTLDFKPDGTVDLLRLVDFDSKDAPVATTSKGKFTLTESDLLLAFPGPGGKVSELRGAFHGDGELAIVGLGRFTDDPRGCL